VATAAREIFFFVTICIRHLPFLFFSLFIHVSISCAPGLQYGQSGVLSINGLVNMSDPGGDCEFGGCERGDPAIRPFHVGSPQKLIGIKEMGF
jgi:hypothetical protein